MKLHKSFLLAPIVVLSMSSCAIIRQRIPINQYILEYSGDQPSSAHDAKPLDSDGDFNILQLSDIHMSVMDNAPLHYAFIKETIKEAKAILQNDPDGPRNLHLIVISGDVFTFSSKETVYELCNFFEEQNVPWTLTFGNHDEQGYYPIDWLTTYLTNLSSRFESNLLFRDFPNDDVFGSANFVIDLPSSGSFTQPRQIVMLDSNRYNYGEGYGYDYIHGDQIDWYIRAREEMKLKYRFRETVTPNSLAFFHIPVPEYLNAYNDAKNPKDPSNPNSTFLYSKLHTIENGEWVDKEELVKRDTHNDTSEGSPKVNTGFYKLAQDLGYTKGMFVGHAHTNTNCMDYKSASTDDNSIALCYGIKSTDRVYSDDNMLGGQLIRYHSKPNEGMVAAQGSAWFDTDLILHKYSDLKEGA